LDSDKSIDVKTGIDFWFTPPTVGKHPRRWKQWLVTTSVIWPLAMYVPLPLEQLFLKLRVLIQRSLIQQENQISKRIGR
jgi:uncharacterized protein